MPQALLDLIGDSEHWIFESDYDNPPTGPPDFARYPMGQNLYGNVPHALASKAVSLCKELGFDGDPKRFKPWFLQIFAWVMIGLKSGASLAGVDVQLWRAAKSAGKRLSTLETAEALKAFDAAPLQEQIARLNYLLEDQTRPVSSLTRLAEGLVAGDVQVFERELAFQRQLGPETFRALIEGRHDAWIPQILRIIRDKESATFVVGALHLVSETGLPAVLAAAGYDFKRIEM